LIFKKGLEMDKQLLAVGGLPDEQDIINFRAQYRKAVQGLYEAYRFGCMLQRVKHALEGNEETLKNQPSLGSDTRDTAENGTRDFCSVTRVTAKNGDEKRGGWNAGLGLKGWLRKHCPEINYRTAMRFLAVAERCQKALAHLPQEDYDQQVRAYLAGTSMRKVLNDKATEAPLTLPKIAPIPTAEARAQRIFETIDRAFQRIESMQRTGETCLLSLVHRRDLVARLKLLTRLLQDEGNL
jgi:hypothetical protein